MRSFVVAGCLLAAPGGWTARRVHQQDTSPTSTEDWPAFRGRNGAGVSAAIGLPTRFDDSTNMAWSVAVPLGRSSPIVRGRQLFLTAWEGDKLLVLGFDVRTGKELWRHSLARARQGELDDRNNDPASPTPTVDGEGLYAFFPDFGLAAVSLAGHELWRLPLGPFVNNYGMASSPIVDGETVYLQCDQAQGSFLLAVDKRTGGVRWRTARPSTIEGWSTPIVVPDRGELVTLSSNGLQAFDRDTGAVRWTLPASNGIMIPLPIVDGERIIATLRGSEEPSFPTWGDTLLDLDANRDGRLTPDEVEKTYGRQNFGIADPNRDGYITRSEWEMFRSRGVGEFGMTSIRLADRSVIWRRKRGLPYVPSPVVFQGVLYSVRSSGIVTALDAASGELRKEARLPLAGGEYFASPVAADGKVFLASDEGKVSVLKAGAEWEVLSTNDLREPIAASPALADDAVFVRTRSRLYCFRQR
jgi:outer membrane protein assembly factor BamB